MALLCCGDDILVPIRIDFTHKGIHYIDSFTWNIYNSILTIEEFVVKLCSDLNFPVTMIPIISSQIQQQVDSYFLLFSLFYHSNSLLFFQEISKYLSSAPIIELTIRHNVLEYSDKFQYNPYTNCCSPEKFAQITCCDLGLPPEMEPTIAFNIRETLLKQLLKVIEDSNSTSTPMVVTDIVSTLNLSLVSSKTSVEMATNLWKDYKPNSADTEIGGLLSAFPENNFSNTMVWQGESELR